MTGIIASYINPMESENVYIALLFIMRLPRTTTGWPEEMQTICTIVGVLYSSLYIK